MIECIHKHIMKKLWKKCKLYTREIETSLKYSIEISQVFTDNTTYNKQTIINYAK